MPRFGKASGPSPSEMRDTLSEAEEAWPESEFVASCQAFFEEAGFLTPKQLTALKGIASGADRDPWN